MTDIPALIKNLHPLEIKVLLKYGQKDDLTVERLTKELGYKEGHANQAFSWLSGKNLLNVASRTPHTFYEITELGRSYAKNGTVEERMVSYLKDNGAHSLSEIATAVGIEAKSVGSAFGPLSKEGVLKMNAEKKAEFTGAELPKRIAVTNILLKRAAESENGQLDASSLSQEEKDVMLTLAKKRGISDSPFRIIERETVVYKLSEALNSVVDSLKKAMQGCSMVYHLAAAIFGFKYEDFYKANAQATHNMVAAANATSSVERFIYMSSLAASGFADKADKPRLESEDPKPISDYGATKLEGEKALSELNPNITWTIFRAPIVYGGSESGVSKIAAWVKRGLMVNTSGNGLFSFVYVGDLVSALAAVPTTAGTEKQIFFVCEEQNYPWPVFIEQMAQAMGVRKPFMPQAPSWMLHVAAAAYSMIARLTGAQPALNYDKIKEAMIPGHWICDGSKWRNLSGQQFTPLKEGLTKSFSKK